MIQLPRLARALLPLLTALLPVGLGSCRSHDSALSATWHPAEQLNARLPQSIRAFELIDESFPLRAWYLRIDLDDEDLRLDLLVADDEDGLCTVSEFGQTSNAIAVINAGYFDIVDGRGMCRNSTVVEGKLIGRSPGNIERYGIPQGGALGILPDGSVEIAWTVEGEGELRRAPRPGKHAHIIAAGASELAASEPWAVVDALQAVPLLLLDGARCNPYENTPPRAPRTAVGLTASGQLVMMVVDGRQGRSVGASFAELTALMEAAGCVDALNLDGGGSSAISVLGRRLNRPGGSASERPVTSALAVFYEPQRR